MIARRLHPTRRRDRDPIDNDDFDGAVATTDGDLEICSSIIDLRHTGASLTIVAGCHVNVIAEQMGHADGGALALAIAFEDHVFDPGRAAESSGG